MISQENFDALFDVLLEILVVKSPYSPQARAAYHSAVSSKLSDEEWIAACSTVINSDVYIPAPSRMIELGRLSRPQTPTLALPPEQYGNKTEFQRMGPEQQKEYLEAISRARAIVLAAMATAPKRVKGFGTICDAMDWLEF